MVHRLENETLSISVKLIGAELCSIKKIETGTEYIWQANPEIWGSHAPVLFPVIGGLKNGRFIFEGNEYSMPKHGIFRNNKNVILKSSSKNNLCFSLGFSEETLKQYPFKFEFEVNFELKEQSVHISHQVFNLDNKPLYFSVGGHPAFNAPVYPGETYEDYYLEFDKKQDLKTCLLNNDGLITDKTSTVTENDDKIPLHKNLFDRDALVFKNIQSKKVALKSKISGTILTLSYPDFKNLGIWAKPNSPYVCIEPWLGIADNEATSQDLKKKEDIISIMPSQTFEASYVIKIE